jgi:hypothetical protein
VQGNAAAVEFSPNRAPSRDFGQDNVFTGNALNGIRHVMSPWEPATWRLVTGLAHVPEFSIFNARMRFGPGAVVKGRRNRLFFPLGLEAAGLPESPVVFTSLKDDANGGDTNNDGPGSAPQRGDWAGLDVQGSSATLSHARVLYGGLQGGPMLSAVGGSTLTVIRSDLRLASATALQASGGTVVSVSSSVVSDNGTGLDIGGECVARIHGSSVAANAQYGVNNTALPRRPQIDARGNWWGSPTGPVHPSNPAGTGDRVSDDVNFDQFLNKAPPDAGASSRPGGM